MQQWIYNNTFKRYLNSLLEYILDFTYWCWNPVKQYTASLNGIIFV